MTRVVLLSEGRHVHKLPRTKLLLLLLLLVLRPLLLLLLLQPVAGLGGQ